MTRKSPSKPRRQLRAGACKCFLVLAVVGSIAAHADTGLPGIRTVVISPVPGSPSLSGMMLVDALATIQPSASDRWLIKIEPGIYDIGAEALRMKPWADIEGSGVLQTVILGRGQDVSGLEFSFGKGVVKGADNAELRNLTVRCDTSKVFDACIVLANGFASPRLTDVRLVSTHGHGSHWGIRNTYGSPILDRVEIVLAGGVHNYGIVNARASQPSIRRALIEVRNGSTSNIAILNREGGLPTVLEDSEIFVEGGRLAAAIQDLNNAGMAEEVFEVIDVTVSVSGAEDNYGFLGGDYRLLIRGSRIEAEGGSAMDFQDFGDVSILNSDLMGSEHLVQAGKLQIITSCLRGGGDVTGMIERCAGVYDAETSIFYTDTCP